MELTAGEVERGLREFYGARGSGRGTPRVFAVDLVGSGFETDVFAFSLQLGEEGGEEAQDLVLRIYAGEGAAAKAAREFAAMRRLRGAGYPVPQVFALEADRSPLGRPLLVMERIHGTSLGRSYWGAPHDQRQQAEAVLCRLMVQLHALDGPAILPGAPLAGTRDPGAFMDRELATLGALLGRLEGREPPSLRGALTWLRDARANVPCACLSVVHGDFHPGNVLMRAGGDPCVIDWSNVRLGDGRADLAWTRLLTKADAQPDRGENLLRLYGQLAGSDVAGIDCFEVAACARLLLSTLISLRFGAARQGMRPAAAALMRREADHTRYVAALLQARTGIRTADLEDALSEHLQ